jgi:predicted Zn finger-like uncharacterized protein
MLTRCPTCRTRFRLHPAQLQAAGGRVRCGQCGNVFDARPVENAGDAPAPQPAATLVSGPRQSSGAIAGLFWFLGIVVLIAALALQFVWWERQKLVSDPWGRKILQQLCRHLPCDVQPPRATEQLTVLERTLTPHPDIPGALLFKLRLANGANHAQPYPLIELRLLDSGQGLLAARRFAPDHYRKTATNAWDLMPPGKPTDIELTLRDPGGHVTGFLLDFL